MAPRSVTRIKVCGITRPEDLAAAVRSGVHAVGFICVPSSPRYVLGRPDWRRLLDATPPGVCRVAVCASLEDAEAAGVLRHCDAVQYYRYEPGTRVPRPVRRIHALRVRDAADLAAADPLADALLLDTYDPDALGGSGRTFDWRLARSAGTDEPRPLIVAGGLGPANVADAIRVARPYAIDVSSGVEQAPGRKDHALVAAFCRAVREADAEAEAP